MKKFTFLAILLTSQLAFSQWTDNYSVNTLVASATSSDIQSVGTADGKTYVVFWDETSGYTLRVQLLDADGNQLFGENGILANAIADNGSWTATRSQAVDADGNLYIAFTATNDGKGYVNKISPSGTQLYGENGVSFQNAWDLKILPLSDGGAIVGWMEGSKGKMMRLDAEGMPAWGSPYEFNSPDSSNPITSVGELSGLSDGSFVGIFHTKATSWGINSIAYAQRFDLNGNPLWDNPVQVSTQTLASNRRYQVLQDGDVTYFGYYGSTGWRFDSFLQRINPDGSTPWGPDGVDFSVDDNYLEMTTSIAMEEGSNVIWAMSNFTNSNQSQYGHFVQKFDKNTGERLLDDFGKQVFPVNDLNYVGIGDLQVVQGKPFFLFSNGISNGANVVELGVVLLDENGNFAWEDEYVMIATGSGSKGRYDFTRNYNGQSVATFTEVRNGVSKAYAQNYKVEFETAGISEVHSLGLEVFPNPTTGMIKINSAKQIQKIEILNLAGSLLKTVNQSNQVDLGNLPKGVYIMKVTSLDGISKTTKVVRK